MQYNSIQSATDLCYVCGGYYKHKTRERLGETGLIEVQHDVIHPACFKRYQRLEKAKKKVLDLEWEHYKKKMEANPEPPIRKNNKSKNI
jgi:hypothetical protein